MTESINPEWQEVVEAESGDILRDISIPVDEDNPIYGDIRFLIVRGPAALCAYVGIPLSHPLAGHNYDLLPIDCHGGLTYGAKGRGSYLPEGYYFYGWDYAHCDDECIYPVSVGYTHKGKQWTVSLVEADSWSALYEFKRLVKLSMGIASKK